MSGPWCLDEINGYLDNSVIPIRLAVQGDTGYPIIASLWFLRQGSTIVCSSQRGARIVQCLRKNLCAHLKFLAMICHITEFEGKVM